MKKLIALTVLLDLSGGVFAGEGWLTNLEKAKEIAKKENKLILLEFTGSDWCPPCKLLKKNIFNKSEFKEYAAKKLVLVELDFPRRENRKNVSKEQAAYNRKLAREFKVSGYPTVFVLNAKGTQLLKQVGYPRLSVTGYLKKLDDARFQ